MERRGRIIIIGAGIAGCVLALHLKKEGFSPVIYERVNQVKDVGGSLSLSPNGLRSLGTIDLAGDLTSLYGYPQIGIKRFTLQKLLIDRLASEGLRVEYGKSLKTIQEDADGVSAIFSDGTQVDGCCMFCCDGIHSVGRSQLFGLQPPEYTGLTQTIGLSPKPDSICDGDFLNVYGVNSFMVAYGYSEGEIAWAATLPEPEQPEVWKGMTNEEQEEFKRRSTFTDWGASIRQMMETTDRIIKVGLYDRPALDVWHRGRVLLIGDAAHPTSPHLGQGANQAMEDCAVLCRILKKHCSASEPLDILKLTLVFEEFEKIRIPRTSELVKSARAMGAVRVVAGAEECTARDERVRHMLNDGTSIPASYARNIGTDL
ncbi:hypothetical protein PROFUN_13834 [Planoprotostelium fungivorum]|uniref:FAD-binding domain-containing protein n=1 Tax=Planoprotostelium fungivorum TaxID=1890364 RepID=A0A2P6N2W7_9EUKA|nr:hypothetical protein PROFUN_13834 [Planoprotostelium fungivorum]